MKFGTVILDRIRIRKIDRHNLSRHLTGDVSIFLTHFFSKETAKNNISFERQLNSEQFFVLQFSPKIMLK